MSISFDSIEDLKEMIRGVFYDIIEEEADKVSSDPAVEPDPDGVGLGDVGGYFGGVSLFVDELDSVLANVDYSLNSATAYWVASEMIRRSRENNLLESEEWDGLAELLDSRGNDLADPRESSYRLPDVVRDPIVWTNILNLLMRTWDPPKGAFTGRDAPSADDAPFHEKIARLKKMVVFARYNGIISIDWPWYSKVLDDLQAMYELYKPDPVTGKMPPVSYAGG